MLGTIEDIVLKEIFRATLASAYKSEEAGYVIVYDPDTDLKRAAATMMERLGYLQKVKDQSDLKGREGYRLTKKGKEIYKSLPKPNADDAKRLIEAMKALT